MTRLLLVLFCTLLVSLGCNRPSYINVPNDGSDAAINAPNWDTTKRIQKSALAYLLSQSELPGDVVIRFPQGTTEETAFEVADALAAYNVFPASATPTDEYHLIEVRKIQARGTRGRVDVIRPGSLRERELVEVHMELTVFDGWAPEFLRVRNIDVDRIDPLLLAAPAAAEEDEPAEVVESLEEGAEEADAVESIEQYDGADTEAD